MRKFAIAFPIICLAALSGCATGPDGKPVINTGVVTDTIAQIQSITQTVCAFVPTASTIASILSGGASANISEIANGICAAVTSPTTRASRGAPKYRGVTIRGRFVR